MKFSKNTQKSMQSQKQNIGIREGVDKFEIGLPYNFQHIDHASAKNNILEVRVNSSFKKLLVI